MARRSRVLLILAVAGLVAAGAATAGKVVVRADVAFTKAGYEYRDLRLSITREGEKFTRRLGKTYFSRPNVTVRDLDADGEPEVWVDTYTGGAHCCDESRFFRFLPARRTYAAALFHSWGNVGYRDKNLDGRGEVELLSNDDRFAYVFTSFALSVFPVQIWHFTHGRLIDVTRAFPGLVGGDAAALWRTYEKLRREQEDVRGVLAAWLADQYLLDRADAGWAKLDAALQRGELGPKSRLAGWPQGRSYLKALRAFLVKTGYAR